MFEFPEITSPKSASVLGLSRLSVFLTTPRKFKQKARLLVILLIVHSAGRLR